MHNTIPFHVPFLSGKEMACLQQVVNSRHLSGDQDYSKLVQAWFEQNHGVSKALLTTSCTHALEMSAILIDTQPGDEIIMPSYTFVSTANAFVLHGAKIVFVDIDPKTMNMDAHKIEAAITSKTKAIVPVHYAGVACDMDHIMALAHKHGLWVIEDAAQCVGAKHGASFLGTIGHLGCYSFHATKNLNCGEGGLLAVNDSALSARADIIREKGTERSRFLRGEIDKYSWVDVGSSYLPSELNAAFLYAQLPCVEVVSQKRLELWDKYYQLLSDVPQIKLAQLPDYAKPNAHIFFIVLSNIQERTQLIQALKAKGISATSHYEPLHDTACGQRYGRVSETCELTTSYASRLLRLPLFESMTEDMLEQVVDVVRSFFK